MEEENIRNKLRHIAGAMDGFTLETLKIATVQAELVEVKEEIRILQGQNETTLGKVSRLENENVLKGDLDILKSQNNTLKGEMVILKEENNGLKNIVNGLQKDFQIFKSRDDARHSNEQESDIAGGKAEPQPVAAKEEKKTAVGSRVERKPKTQRRREQSETFRNWPKAMAQRKTSEDLWASGLLKVTIELWEDGIYMDGDQISEFIRRNIDQFTTYMSSEESRKRFFLTIIMMCSVRKVSKQKFEDIMLCFVNQGPRNNRITELEVREFLEMYKE